MRTREPRVGEKPYSSTLSPLTAPHNLDPRTSGGNAIRTNKHRPAAERKRTPPTEPPRTSSGSRAGVSAVSAAPTPAWHLERPRRTPLTEAARVFVKALHSAAVLIFAAGAVYLIYCGITGTRDAWMVAALVAVGVEGLIYLSFGVKCPLTMLARWLGDDGGHDYLFEWLLGSQRIWLVSRSLALLAAAGVALILVGTLRNLFA